MITEKEFWEWCGVEIIDSKYNGYPSYNILFPDGKCETHYSEEMGYSITSDNLLKYAVKDRIKSIIFQQHSPTDWRVSFLYPCTTNIYGVCNYYGDGESPEIALYKAICKVIELERDI